MPELPEVETIRRGLAPWLEGRVIRAVQVRQKQLRWPIPDAVQALQGQIVQCLTRRGKYLLLRVASGTALLHLGMSGSLRVVDTGTLPGKHDHFDLVLDSGRTVRYHDPRRFGALLWTTDAALQHPLLCKLGPEPLEDGFSGDYLHQLALGRRVNVKAFIMDAHVVVGVGNIYANEALFLAGIDPRRAAGDLSRQEYGKLAQCIQSVLGHAITQGGTTLRDFVREDGAPGYFQLELKAYGQTGKPCCVCQTPMQHITQGQRSTWFCPACQH